MNLLKAYTWFEINYIDVFDRVFSNRQAVEIKIAIKGV